MKLATVLIACLLGASAATISAPGASALSTATRRGDGRIFETNTYFHKLVDVRAAAKKATSTTTAASSSRNKTLIMQQMAATAAASRYNGVMTAHYGDGALIDDDSNIQMAFGSQDLRGLVPNTITTRYPIASNTKLIISAAILQLVERGLIKSIQDDVSNYLDVADFAAWGLPDLQKFCMYVYNDPNKTCYSFTFEQLMGMSTGISRPTVNFQAQFSPLLQTIGVTWGVQFPQMFLLFPPGTNYFYSNENYMLLSYIIEKLTQKELSETLKETIFEPLGMSDTYFDRLNGLFYYDANRTEEGMRYFLYDAKANAITKQIGVGKCQNDLDLGGINGAGGVVSTVSDEAKLWYCLFDMNPTTNAKRCPKQILTLKSRQQIITPYMPVVASSTADSTTFYGLGIDVVNTTGPYDISNGRQYPDYISYTGTLMCCNTGNYMKMASRATGSIDVMTQAFESQRAIIMANEGELAEAQATNGVSLFSLPETFRAAYTAGRMMMGIMAIVLGA